MKQTGLKNLRLTITYAGGKLVYHLRAPATMDALSWASARMGNVAHTASVRIMDANFKEVM